MQTIRHSDEPIVLPRFTRHDIGPMPAQFNPEERDEMELDSVPEILRIAIDFGTTFSSVAYARTPVSGYFTSQADIGCITSYPGDTRHPVVAQIWEPRQDVPTELWYPKTGSESRKTCNGIITVQSEDSSGRELSPESDASSVLSVAYLEREQTPPQNSQAPSPGDATGSLHALAWGFEPHNSQTVENVLEDNERYITKFKLLLHEPDTSLAYNSRNKDQEIEDIKMDVITRLNKLKKLGLIKTHTDVIAQFLEKLLLHVRYELQKLDRLDSAVDVEFTICVPAEWSSKACRIMQDCLATASQRSGFDASGKGVLGNLFFVSEPEAAATCIIAEHGHDIYAGETIVVLDAGGGTVDAITYEVTKTLPLRMSAEIVPPKTKACGGSYVNHYYAKFLRTKLAAETYLEKNGKTISSIIERKVNEFEHTTKRFWDLHNDQVSIKPIYIDDLRPSHTDGQLQKNYLLITKLDVERIFRKSLKGTVSVLEDQLDMAKVKGCSVEKVLLTGGFGQSPFLQSYLRYFLAKHTNYRGDKVSLLVPKAGATAVARGAILRASDKKHGPIRQSSCSYGFLRSEPYEPMVWEAHKVTKPRVDRIDGEKYVHDTIDWLFLKNEELEVGKEKSFIVRQTFPSQKQHLICNEHLYVSDDFKFSHYRRTHPMNKGAEKAGFISVDMTFLRTEGHIEPQPVSETSSPLVKNKKVWVVEFELVVIVDGRNLVYEARWPVLKGRENMSSVEQRICQRGQTCIAATFKPGTA